MFNGKQSFSFAWPILAATVLSFLLPPAGAEPADSRPDDNKPLLESEWLFAAADFDPDGQLEGGLLLRIAPGWHTYGPDPGDLGVPPILKIRDLQGIQVGVPLYPATQPFEEPTGISMGFADTVLIRFRFKSRTVETRDPDKPFTLEGEFLLCRDICIPEFLKHTIDWPRPETGNWAERAERWRKALKSGGWHEALSENNSPKNP